MVAITDTAVTGKTTERVGSARVAITAAVIPLVVAVALIVLVLR